MPLISRIYSLHRWLSADRTATYHYIQSCAVATFATSLGRQTDKRGLPLLTAERSDGTVEEIPEEELYRYTRNRWMHVLCPFSPSNIILLTWHRYNESTQLAGRYLKFNLQELVKVAVTALSSEGARYCTKLLKCREGLNNKAYLLTMDNGSEIFAKLPNPIAGPAYYTTASEVATREFLRDALHIPNPRIIAWSADRSNPVGAEYILEEKAPGKPLGSLWYQWPMKFKLGMISQVVEIERQLASTKFVKSGSIYFKGDIPRDMRSDNAIATSVPRDSSVLERFQLGPLVSSGLWRGERANMDMDRGPYNEPLDFIKAVATNEIRFIKTHARPRLNYHRSSTQPELPEEVLDLLQRYLKLSPAMIPPPGTNEDTHSPTLWHPDLHLDNIFVDPETKKITRIIDWQSASVMPLFYQCGVPRMFQHPGTVRDNWELPDLPEDYDTLEPNEKASIDSDRESEICLKYYKAETNSQNPRHWAALLQLQLHNTVIRTEPSRLVPNVWEDRDVFFLRQALLSIIEQWQDLCPDSGTCPVSSNQQELALHAAEEESMGNVGEILRMFREGWGVPPSGMVDPGGFDEVLGAVDELRSSFVEEGDDEVERELFGKIWPFRDTDV
ncbi:hypothetical protein ONS95_004638 [Cadophora gregata]|uniref:uncharacterized protein n=1 Tax=Cadophora gregata TaxID=51156 RepID=UPI0026DBD0E3|nr:uncharacterized protein ONS95_004638 [Cadophora gregata]KAK0106136.1 hypothetical protein ONS95_004638 [Cadophora gregata]